MKAVRNPILCVLMLTLASAATGKTLYVPSTEYPTIQAAIYAAVDGDQVAVDPGTYAGRVSLRGKAIRLYSSGGPGAATIDGEGTHCAVYCTLNEGPDTILEGFNITNGYATYGGGMYNRDSSPTVIDCTFSGNEADYGGGMYNNNSSPTVTNCTFSGNEADYGGGMRNLNNSNPTLTHCTFTGNTANSRDGGMYNSDSSPTLTHCTFEDNTAAHVGGMYNNNSSPTLIHCTFTGNMAILDTGGMRNYQSNPTLTNCTFTGNSAGDDFGGMYNSNSSPTLTNCTFTGNSAGDYGGGMSNVNSSNPTLTNCTFSSNEAGNYGGGMHNYNSSPTLTNCILWGNTATTGAQIHGPATVTYSDVQGGWSGDGNIDVDPQSEPGTLRLLPGSPCIDAGSNDAVPSGITTDLDANARFVDDPGTPDTGFGTPPIVDMGAYEFRPKAVHNVTKDLWYDTIQSAIDASSNGDQIEAASGQYNEAIDFKGMAVRLYSTGGPGWATIEGGRAPHVVKCVMGESADTTLEGFTITGGNANGSSFPDERGGGMYNQGSSPTVINCVFAANTAVGYGGGMSNNWSNPTVTGCTFEANSSDNQCGGMHNDQSSPTVTDCTFNDNTAAGNGGGMGNTNNSDPTVSDCTFNDNTAAQNGGGMNNSTSSPTVTNCGFSANSATYGGGMGNNASSPTVNDCTFSGNQTGRDGAGMHNCYNSSPSVNNCTFAHNEAARSGGAMVNYSGGIAQVSGCEFNGNSADDKGGAMYNEESSPEVTDCSFSSNSAEGHAGGMYNVGNNPTVTDCAFSNNTTAASGGGMRNVASDATLINCTFTENSGNYAGGLSSINSNLTLTGCSFVGNSATIASGGMGTYGGDPVLTNCNFDGNSAAYGGGVNFDQSPAPILTNCTFFENSADYGGGLHNWGSNPMVINCTFTHNTATTGGGGIASDTASSPTAINCILWANLAPAEPQIYGPGSVSYSDVEGGWGGTGNINANPLFVNAAEGDLRLASSGSPCVDTGQYPPPPELPDTDLAGNNRVVDGDENGTAIVDMGAYEFQPKPVHNITQDLRYETIQAAIDEATDEDQIKVAAGTYYEAIDFLGKPIWLFSTAGPNETTINGGGAYHVVKCVNGEGPGTILEGFTITGGNADGGWPDERGAGMYNQGTSPTVINCIFTDNYAAGYGGGMSNNGGSPTVSACAFEGNAAEEYGGGMHNDTSNPTVTDCNFTGNTTGGSGGGMVSVYSSLVLTNCTFTANTANRNGGGMNTSESSGTVTNCTFTANSANLRGGGMRNDRSSPTVTDCTFTTNSAGSRGGGMGNFPDSSPTVINCAFSDNVAVVDGGGMWNADDSHSAVTNCIFTANSAGGRGGGMWNDGSNPMLTNCTFTGNLAWKGGGIRNDDSSPTVTNCTFSDNTATAVGGGMWNLRSSPTVTNCILWGNIPDEIFVDDSTATVTYSNVQGGTSQPWFGEGCIDANPNFADGDGRLLPGSPCIDAGDNDAVEVETDLDGNRRITDGGELDSHSVVDMGAYEAPGPIHVPGDFATIQAAIDDVINGEQIAVAPGTYEEAIDLLGKAIRLFSTGGPDETTINGAGAPHVVQCISGEGPDTVLEGFTITGGNADGESWPNERGGGMYNQGTSPTVTNCIFTGNHAAGYGGGMSNNWSDPTVTGCSFEGNSSDNHCGGMHNDHCSPTLINCKFIGNSAVNNGGGIGNTNDSSPTITNCTFTANSGGYGAAISNMGGSNPGVTNCILWGDSGSEIGGSAVVTYSDVEGGWSDTGNIDADPMFADGDARPWCDSPCIDAGDNAAVPSGVTTDLDGNPRFVDFPGIDDTGSGTPPIVDMGAYEYVWADADSDGIEDSIDTQPLVESNDFNDGSTSGTILQREDQLVVVADAPDPLGVRVSASGGTTPAEVSVCGAAVFMLDAGDATVVRCGSVEIAVVQGTVEIAFVAEDGTHAQTVLNAGNGIEFEPETCTITAPETNSEDVIVIVDGGEIVLGPGESKLIANVDIDPDTLSLKSKGNWITCYVELPQDLDVGDIDVGTVRLMLDEGIAAEPGPTEVGDYDGDGVADLMVKFDLAETQALLEAADAVQISVAGQLSDGTEFEGHDTIRVIEPGAGKN